MMMNSAFQLHDSKISVRIVVFEFLFLKPRIALVQPALTEDTHVRIFFLSLRDANGFLGHFTVLRYWKTSLYVYVKLLCERKMKLRFGPSILPTALQAILRDRILARLSLTCKIHAEVQTQTFLHMMRKQKYFKTSCPFS